MTTPITLICFACGEYSVLCAILAFSNTMLLRILSALVELLAEKTSVDVLNNRCIVECCKVWLYRHGMVLGSWYFLVVYFLFARYNASFCFRFLIQFIYTCMCAVVFLKLKLYIHRESKKKQDTILLSIASPKSTDFQNSFTVRLSKKLAIKLSLKIPPHLRCIATLPCEMLEFKNRSNSVNH